MGCYPFCSTDARSSIWTKLNKNLLYKLMKDGSFPFPVEVSEGIVRWTSTSVITHMQSSQQTGHTLNGQSQAPPFAPHGPLIFQLLDSNDTDEWYESATTITAMTGEHGAVTTCWPFPGRLREEEVLYMLSVSPSSLERIIAREPLLRPHYLSGAPQGVVP